MAVHVQGASAKRDAERGKLVATNAQLRHDVSELRALAQRLDRELQAERRERSLAALAARDAAAERGALAAACEAAAAEVAALQAELERVKARVAAGAVAAEQRTQVWRAPHSSLLIEKTGKQSH